MKRSKNPENAEVVVEDEVDSDKINIGCKVDVLDLEYDEEIEFQIVGSTEANSPKRKNFQRVSGRKSSDRRAQG